MKWAFRYLVPVFLVLLLFQNSSLAQSTSEGRDFWFAFSRTFITTHYLRITASDQSADVVIDIPSVGFFETHFVDRNTTIEVELPKSVVTQGSSGRPPGIHVTTSSDARVYALGIDLASTEMSMILPTNVLGDDYFVFSHGERSDGTSGPLQFASLDAVVVSTADNTEIEIIPMVELNGNLRAGVSHRVVLNQGETFQMQSTDDMTGTRIRVVSQSNEACEGIAVFGGNVGTFVGGCGTADYLYEQMMPVSSWGTEYLYVPFDEGKDGDLVKIVAAEDNTEIKIGNDQPFELNSGDVQVFDVITGVQKIESNKPIGVVQFRRGDQCMSGGDPFMVSTLPLDRMIEEASFSYVLVGEFTDQRLLLVAHAGSISGITLNNTSLTSEFTVVGDLAYAYINDMPVFSELKAPGGVLAYGYGYGSPDDSSVGYLIGATFQDTEIQIEALRPDLSLIDKQVCLDEAIRFKPVFDPPEDSIKFTNFRWEFGDGNVAEGNEVLHSYSSPGNYNVTLKASGEGACRAEEGANYDIQVIDTSPAEIMGPTSVCPNVEGVQYATEPDVTSSFKWIADGGDIVGTDVGSSVLVNWGDTREDANLKLAKINELGCVSDTTFYSVKINEQLEPRIPEGPDILCYTDRNDVSYGVSPTPGSVYTWGIEGGEIVSGNGTAQIVVNWTSAVGRLWFQESTTTRTDVCAGTSPELAVAIQSEIVVTPTVKDVNCYEGSDGEISLKVSGGTAPYDFVWSTGERTVAISQLTEATYDVTITDASGCVVERKFRVDAPDELTAVVETTMVLCNGNSDGTAEAFPTGGTSPYLFSWNDGPLSEISLNETLPAGDHWVKVVDANGCEFQEMFRIDEPDPLTAVTTDTPTCPGENSGTIYVEASGGTRPYTYRWNISPPQDAQLIQGLPAGKYSVTVTDANGCQFTFPEEEIAESYPIIRMPNAFRPTFSADPANRTFKAVYFCPVDFEMRVFNQWGGLIFFSDDIDLGWDGTHEGQQVPEGTYSYQLAYHTHVNGLEVNEVVSGTVRLIR